MSWLHRRVSKIGDYAVVEKIGQGGTGDVYKARHPTTDAIVAVKTLNRKLAGQPVLLKRFELEFDIMRSLKHPHIVRALDFGVVDDVPFLVMEFIDGETLWQRIRKQGRLSVAEAMQLLQPVGDALQTAHENDLVHRDVKPDNILIDEHGQSKLTDFGLVKDLQADLLLTESATSLGTPNFMAPEQFQDSKRVDRRCDIYGLAATIYMAVTGIIPFGSQGRLSILKKKLLNDLILPRQVIADLPLSFEWHLMRALRIERNERPNSCAELLAGLTDGNIPKPAVTEEPVVVPQQTEERRRSPRFTCNLEGDCVPFDQRNGKPWPARVVDVSTSGLALVLQRRFEPRHVLRVILPFAAPLGKQPVYVRVINVESFVNGGWRIGCQFANELDKDDLQLLLDELPYFDAHDSEVECMNRDMTIVTD